MAKVSDYVQSKAEQKNLRRRAWIAPLKVGYPGERSDKAEKEAVIEILYGKESI